MLKEKLHPSTAIVNQPSGSKDTALEQSNDIEHLMNGHIRDIQNDSRISAQTIDKMYNDIMTKIDNYNNMIQTAIDQPLSIELPQTSRAVSPMFEVNESDAPTVASSRNLHLCESTSDSSVKKCKLKI